MASEITIKLGTKPTEDEKKQIDQAKVVKLQAQPSTDAVQAQLGMVALCPYCGGIGYNESVNPGALPGFYICSCCGLMFKA